MTNLILFGTTDYRQIRKPRQFQTRGFNSKFDIRFTEGVDAFHCYLSNEINYLVSPVFLISRVVKHLKKCRRKGVLLVSYWPLTVFWPLIFETKNIYKLFIKDTNIFYNSQEIITQGNNKKCFIGSNKFSSPIFATIIDIL